MAQQTSVVTPERFAQGLTYEQWIAQIDRNQARFDENYKETELPEDEIAALRELVARPDGPARCLALGEAWCPDVFRGLPVMARVAEATGIELRRTTATSRTGSSVLLWRTSRCRSCAS
jgi:hypothetical protein